jgi:3-deoxy-manno-octulosonate cytidylyltransferase (CMP-KDO synthetase)
VVATCDEEIREAAAGFGAEVVMTSAAHERASERMAEVAHHVDGDLFVLVQGDEPMIRPEMIAVAVAPFDGGGVRCVNLMAEITDVASFRDPNTIKVVVDAESDALFMSRQPIPTQADPDRVVGANKQVCIIPFDAATLAEYEQLPQTPLEKAESIDMMRLIEHGIPVRMVPTDVHTQAVDTEQDRQRVETLLESDPLTRTY